MNQAVDYTAQVSVILAAPVLDTILQKMYPVFNADQGRFRVASIAANWQDLERNVRNMKADKGGTGKTTLAANFAYELNRVGVRTLLMGFDTSLLLANTLILVALPGYTDQVKTVQTIKLLTETLAGQHRIPKENIFRPQPVHGRRGRAGDGQGLEPVRAQAQGDVRGSAST